MKKTYSKLALGLVAIAILFALVSFLRENWSANESPGSVETFLAKGVLAWARRGDASTPNPLQPTEENLQDGRRQYEKQCAFCHGLDGKGPEQTGVQFYPRVPSLVKRPDKRTDGQMQSIIAKGIRYTAMPSFEKALSADQIWKTVLWVRHLPQVPPPEQSPGNQSPGP